MWGGSQLAVDTYPDIPLHQVRWGKVTGRNPCQSRIAGCTQEQGKDLPRRCRFVVLGIEVGGRWSNEVSSFIRMLAQARARSSPPSLRAATASALVSRWSALLTHGAASCPPTRALMEISHPSANSFIRHQPSCADQSPRSPVDEGLDLDFPVETGQYKNSRCLEAAQKNSSAPENLRAAKKMRGKKNSKPLQV